MIYQLQHLKCTARRLFVLTAIYLAIWLGLPWVDRSFRLLAGDQICPDENGNDRTSFQRKRSVADSSQYCLHCTTVGREGEDSIVVVSEDIVEKMLQPQRQRWITLAQVG